MSINDYPYADRRTGGCYGQAEAGPAIGAPRSGECIPLPRGLKDLAGAAFPPPNTLNRTPELEVVKSRLANLCERAHTVLFRTRTVADKLFGPLNENAKEPCLPVGEGAAIASILSFINEAERMLSLTQDELARLETL